MSLLNVVINTYHVFTSNCFKLKKNEHTNANYKIKNLTLHLDLFDQK